MASPELTRRKEPLKKCRLIKAEAPASPTAARLPTISKAIAAVRNAAERRFCDALPVAGTEGEPETKKETEGDANTSSGYLT